MLTFDSSYTSGGAVGVDTSLIRWDQTAQVLDAVSGGVAVTAGGLVARWLAGNGSDALDQTTSGKRPTLNASVFPGRSGLEFSADDNLAGTPPAFQGALLVIVGAGVGTIISRDTSQTTTAPAFSVAVEEYFP